MKEVELLLTGRYRQLKKTAKRLQRNFPFT